jgi:hypothetical protein
LKLPGYHIDYKLFPGQSAVKVRAGKGEHVPRGSVYRVYPGEDVVGRGIVIRPTGAALPLSASPRRGSTGTLRRS